MQSPPTRAARPDNANEVAGIEYSGLAGITKACMDAVMRLLQYGDHVTHARVLSCEGTHCLLLSVNVGDLIAVKSGFGSGYLGEGSRGFSYVLQLLEAHGAEIEEYDVASDVIERLDNSALTEGDISQLDAARPVSPRRWTDYMFEEDWHRDRDGTLWREFPSVVPFAIIDRRIADLALTFWNDPDASLVTGYRRLEDIVRERTGINEHSTQLFTRAFMGRGSKLGWGDLEESEQAGRASLFKDAFLAHRNPRAHRELKQYPEDQLAEFLVLNHLYRLESQSSPRSEAETPGAT